MAEEETTLEYTPTWVVALVCTVIILISLTVERILFYTDKYLEKKTKKPVFEALQKIKQELVLGVIALLLTTFQEHIGKICITEKQASYFLPCKKQFVRTNATADSTDSNGYCAEGKVPLLTATAWQHLQMFIFVLAAVHATFSVLTILFARARIRQWKQWEDSISKTHAYHSDRFTITRDHPFIRGRGGNYPAFLHWLMAFFKQFFGSVNKIDYMMMRTGFIKAHLGRHSTFNFHTYMMRALESDFKRVVGISWYLWFSVVIFLLLNVWGWHAYFWITFIPLVLLLAVGTKLEYVITQMANEVEERYVVMTADAVVNPSDDHFWLHKPELLLFLIHIILFQNSFQLAFFFWIWYQYRFDSCMMGKVGYVIPRLAIGAFIQLLCSYSIFPLYAIVTQMGSSFKPAIFETFDTARSITNWQRAAKRSRALRKAASSIESRQEDADLASIVVQLSEVKNHESSLNNGTEIRNYESSQEDSTEGEIKPEEITV